MTITIPHLGVVVSDGDTIELTWVGLEDTPTQIEDVRITKCSDPCGNPFGAEDVGCEVKHALSGRCPHKRLSSCLILKRKLQGKVNKIMEV